MSLHGLSVSPWPHQRRAGPLGRADGAEEIGAFVALISRLSRPCAGARPLAHRSILLSQAHLVLPPKRYGCAGGQMRDRRRERLREILWNGPPPPAGPLD